METPERIVAVGAALYKSYLDRGKKEFQVHVPMHTYLEYETLKNEFAKLLLDDYKDGKLPLEPNPPKTCPIPSGIDVIHLKVYQEHTYGKNRKREVVESVRFEKINGKAERLRLEYKINQNGILEVWRPLLINKQKTVVKTGSFRQYDWIDRDPTDISTEFGINTS